LSAEGPDQPTSLPPPEDTSSTVPVATLSSLGGDSNVVKPAAIEYAVYPTITMNTGGGTSTKGVRKKKPKKPRKPKVKKPKKLKAKKKKKAKAKRKARKSKRKSKKAKKAPKTGGFTVVDPITGALFYRPYGNPNAALVARKPRAKKPTGSGYTVIDPITGKPFYRPYGTTTPKKKKAKKPKKGRKAKKAKKGRKAKKAPKPKKLKSPKISKAKPAKVPKPPPMITLSPRYQDIHQNIGTRYTALGGLFHHSMQRKKREYFRFRTSVITKRQQRGEHLRYRSGLEARKRKQRRVKTR
jgi:hypothetical protein